MGRQKKITVYVPEALLQRAQSASNDGITGTIRKGLELVAAGEAYRKLRTLRGKVKISLNLSELRED